MHKEETTFLDYTRSAEELRMFELNEKCREIAHEYEKFNIENGIYDLFGEWFLSEVKTGYNTTFTSYQLAKIISDKNIEPPKTYLIASKEDDYEKCQSLRDICVNDTLSLGSYKSNYAWYTMWKITKAYNGKHGCVVTATPNRDWRSSEMLKIKMDWSQDAVNCVTGEKWREEANKSELGVIASAVFGLLIWLAIWLVTILIFYPFANALLIFFAGAIAFSFIFAVPIRRLSISDELYKLSQKFKKHCENIEKTKISEFDVDE